MMDACKENKLRVQCEDERNLARQKIVMLEKEIKEQAIYRSTLEEQKKMTEEAETILKTRVDERTKDLQELRAQCQKSLARTDELRREVEHEKKLTEECQLRCTKGNVQKGPSEQVEVSLEALA